VRHRGQYCYVAALLPGRSDPTPILRLRYQGSADHWAIAIYKASTGQYTEAELPGSFGPATGTPEQGIDDTLIPTPTPEPETDRAHSDTRQNCESRVIDRPRLWSGRTGALLRSRFMLCRDPGVALGGLGEGVEPADAVAGGGGEV
jgi:hypothetical protein